MFANHRSMGRCSRNYSTVFRWFHFLLLERFTDELCCSFVFYTVREERCSQLGWKIRLCAAYSRVVSSLPRPPCVILVQTGDFSMDRTPSNCDYMRLHGRRTASNHLKWPNGPQQQQRRRRRMHLSWHWKPWGCALAAAQCHSSLQLNNALQKQLVTDFCSIASTQVSVYAVVL